VTYPVDDPTKARHEIIFTTDFDASGAARSVPAHVIAPDELPDGDIPMVLSTGRVLEHWHTGSMTPALQRARPDRPRPVAFMCKGHAAE